MRIKDALENIHRTHEKDHIHSLYTPWGETLDKECVWQEYPRPQMKRESYHMLNGEWEYCIVPLEKDVVEAGERFAPDGRIVVPFSPESLLSGVGRQLKPDEYLWYQREVEPTKEAGRCLLHFDAVDQKAWVYIDGKEVCYHEGGYLPFVIDITEYMTGQVVLLQVKVRDVSDTSYESRGKQKLKRGGMFYTAQSGIWQSVWYEWAPENYIDRYCITPQYDEAKVCIDIYSGQSFEYINCEVLEATCIVSKSEAVCEAGMWKTSLEIVFEGGKFSSWTPENPHLYEFVLTADEDVVSGYFAMRTFTLEKDEKGMNRVCLNHKPYFMHGILDQGYWPDGLMTAPCDEAFVYDIELVKKSGFNMIRKHIKIEPLRWYYHCDRLGVVVWQDMVNGGTDYHMGWTCYFPTVFPKLANKIKDHHYFWQSRVSKEGREKWEQECMDTMEHLYNVPSLAVWVPFNEGWGQFDAARITAAMKQKDETRLIDHASGWFDQKEGNFRSVHNYFRPLKVELEQERAFVISEYGGYACHIKGHSSVDRSFGYKKFQTIEELSGAVHTLFETQLFPLIEKGLCGAVYTQVSDIEEEVNGLVTYDRRIVKVKEKGEQ